MTNDNYLKRISNYDFSIDELKNEVAKVTKTKELDNIKIKNLSNNYCYKSDLSNRKIYGYSKCNFTTKDKVNKLVRKKTRN